MRTIARIDIKNQSVIKGINLEGLRKIGNPENIAKEYYLNGIDEIHWPLIKQIVLEVHNINDRLNKIINILKKQGFKLKIEKEPTLKETDLFNIYAKRK